MSPAVAAGGRYGSLEEQIDELAHSLPNQGPLNVFVHHNTLHSFEHLAFEDAVVEAARTYGTEPYMSEAAFAEHLARGRILSVDLEAVLADEDDAHGAPVFDTPVFDGGPPRSRFRVSRLRHVFEVPRGVALEWALEEGGARTAWHPIVDAGRRAELLRSAERTHGPRGERELTVRTLDALWNDLARRAPRKPAAPVGPRRRDELLAAGDVDVDKFVHRLLIRLCAAYLDQGVAYWPMPGRELGFLVAVRRLCGARLPSPEPWFRGSAREFRRQEREGWSAEQTIEWALDELEVPGDLRPEYLRATALALRGWAGMMRRFEKRPDEAPVEPQPARLVDFLAVRLVLDVFASRRALRAMGRARQGFAGLASTLPEASARPDLELAYEAFVLAQALEVEVADLGVEENARAWLGEVQAFHEIERRRLLHLAYERRHRVEVLDGLVAHSRMRSAPEPEPLFQAVFCIDERECSTRRHLEEAHPRVETFGYAGFFGVVMAYQGLDDIRPRPLCPVNLVPRHCVRERALKPAEEQAYLAARRRQGSLAYSVSVGSKTLSRGGVLAPVLGIASVVPLIGRCLAPRFAERLAHRLRRGPREQPPTRLALLRRGEEVDADGRKLGFSSEEMADVVAGLLRATALDPGRTRLVLIVGHGSASLNNPHEAAHDCGATGGGRGGPNARAFASMANRRDVRDLLRERGVVVPESTWFLGAYHNTCDDSMHYYDLDLVPDELAADVRNAQRAMEAACDLDAHERCRRFESFAPGSDVSRAKAHVEARAVDLAQPRPEYGHATNAVALVGRRSRTRGLFLDRRAFLASYDPRTDPEGHVLEQLLGAVVPVGAGISLEYYFSYVDPVGYGSGTKLPHNITGLIGVMDGHASDLRTGLPWQMVEIHEPVRLLTIVEARREVIDRILLARPELAEFLANRWVQFVRWEPDTDRFEVLTPKGLVEYVPEYPRIPVVEHSSEYYSGHARHLGCARANAALPSEAAAGRAP